MRGSRVTRLTGRFPRGFYFLADQLNRASLSIAANIAEGNGRFTKADRRNFFGIARGSVQECVPLLEVARRHGFIDDNRDGSSTDLIMTSSSLRKRAGGMMSGGGMMGGYHGSCVHVQCAYSSHVIATKPPMIPRTPA